MNTKTLKALKQSIAHWKRMEAGRRKRGEGIGIRHCALCKEFLGPCFGCPVEQRTGESNCIGTPYVPAWNAAYKNGSNSRPDFSSMQFHAAAKKERRFLESLLPKKRKARK